MSRTHVLSPNAVHHAWDATMAPAIEVEPGDRVDVTVSTAAGRFTSRERIEAYLREGAGDADRQPLAGPVLIRGALPGQAVCIEILAVEVDAWGYTSVGPGGLHGPEVGACVLVWDMSDGRAARLDPRTDPDVAVPLAPFPGIVGVAPAGRPLGTRAPGAHGGNLDSRRLVRGARLWLPVMVEGALLSFGDLHAAQGDGEVAGTAIETTGRLSVRVTIEPALRIEGPIMRAPVRALARPGDELLCAAGVGPDPRSAARDAVRRLVDRLVSTSGMSPCLSMGLVSVAADLSIDQLVDEPNWTVSCCLPLDVIVRPPVEGRPG